MTTTSFNDGWAFRRADETVAVYVRLPHDAMIRETRSSDAETGNHGGYFPGGVYIYTKRWIVPADADDRDYSLVFEGVYGDARVLLDGREVGRCDSGYREFAVALEGLRPGATATIDVHVDNSRVPNSRWYTGSGIYRPVWLESSGRLQIPRDGIMATTRKIGVEAVVDVAVRVEGDVPLGATMIVEFLDGERVIARRTTSMRVDGMIILPLTIANPRLWSAESPHLYDLRVELAVDGEAVDERRIRTGVRTVKVDSRHGLRINGTSVLLRGACVHHDSGILGAATFAASERRRARLLKDAGFNAIRSAHNPLSRAFLDACDELGLYVMDELTDVWMKHKTPNDGADRFEEMWEADAAAMIATHRNHPSVIMYSIGNEIAETATVDGVDAAHRLHDYFTANDPTRPTTLAVNLLLNLMASRGSSAFEREEYTGEKKPSKKEATSTVANMVTARLGRIMNLVSRLPAADKASRDAFAAVDVAGYNYAYGRYRADRKKYPDRVIVGSESMPGDLPAIWKRVTRIPGVIGDFMWTGWDYLGEAGIGIWSYGTQSGSINKPYPALVAGPGAFDITGLPGAPALLAAAVWNTADAPGISVRPLDVTDERANKSPWRSTDAICSWSWRGLSGKAEVQVYSADEEVELWLNGRCLGRKRAGARVNFVARFTTQYEPGELVAIAYQNGVETGRGTLRSAGPLSLRLRAESTELDGPDDLTYVWAELADEFGTVDSYAADVIAVAVSGAGSLAGLGSAAPMTEESFIDHEHSTYRGRALAIIRGSERNGDVSMNVTSRRHGSAEIVLHNQTANRIVHA
ncbi:Glycosyl hydrolases family 2 [Microbacterium sp. cf046]|nr:Glycosyl hydrolases family 2 [Microbacterium sp. cf046]